VFSHGKGARFHDTSGNEYIDYCLGSGPLILGHAHPAVVEALSRQAARGTHFFAYLNEPGVRYAKKLVELVPCAEKLRFTTSGSDATFHAIRLARAFTGRERILKFEGAYHGHHDYAQLSTSPKHGVNYPTALPDSAGIPKTVQDLMLVAPYNDLDAVSDIVAAHAAELAAVIVEPIQRIISPAPGFLAGLREITAKHGVLLIFDEVVTGFRLALGGAQSYFGVIPDLCTLGKIVGGGTPVGAVAGRADILDQCDPRHKGEEGYVYQNGTLNGNPLGSAGALATLGELENPGVYETLFGRTEELRAGVGEVLRGNEMPAICFGEGPMWHILFTDRVPQNHRDVMAADGKALMRFDYELIRQGVFVLPGTRRFMSLAHTARDLEDTYAAVDRACHEFRE
jgi:glutamate-1-semialdehyde 2,1-aminomutase